MKEMLTTVANVGCLNQRHDQAKHQDDPLPLHDLHFLLVQPGSKSNRAERMNYAETD